MNIISDKAIRTLAISRTARVRRLSFPVFNAVSFSSSSMISTVSALFQRNQLESSSSSSSRGRCYSSFASAAAFAPLHSSHSQRRQEMSSQKMSSDEGDHNTVRGALTNRDKERQQDHAYCVKLVQSRDMEGYLCGLLMPASAREPFFAIRAFNAEIATVKDGGGLGRRRTSAGENILASGDSSSLGSKLRMQWWRDALSEMFPTKDDSHTTTIEKKAPSADDDLFSSTSAASRQSNPVVRAMHRAVSEYDLTGRFLERMLNAREADLDIDQYSTLQEVVQYAEDTVSSMSYLSLECCGVREERADTVASHVGVGVGMVTAIRSTLYRAAFGEISIPADVMERRSVPVQFLLNPPASILNNEGDKTEWSHADQMANEALKKAVRDMAHVAAAHLIRARDNQHLVPKAGRSSLLPAVGALIYLKKVERTDYDLFHIDLNMSKDSYKTRLESVKTNLLLARAWMTGVF